MAEQGIVRVIQLSRSSNFFKEVHPANNLLIFRLDQNYIVDASISKILIRNFERPIMRGNLFVSNKLLLIISVNVLSH
jgi:hypothetical protein